MLVSDVACLEGIGLRPHLEDQIDDVLERQVVGMRPVPAALAQVANPAPSSGESVSPVDSGAAHENPAFPPFSQQETHRSRTHNQDVYRALHRATISLGTGSITQIGRSR